MGTNIEIIQLWSPELKNSFTNSLLTSSFPVNERQQRVPAVPSFAVSTSSSPPLPISLPAPLPLPVTAPTPLTHLEALRLSGVLPPSQESLLAITQMLLNQAKLSQKEAELHSRVMKEQQLF